MACARSASGQPCVRGLGVGPLRQQVNPSVHEARHAAGLPSPVAARSGEGLTAPAPASRSGGLRHVRRTAAPRTRSRGRATARDPSGTRCAGALPRRAGCCRRANSSHALPPRVSQVPGHVRIDQRVARRRRFERGHVVLSAVAHRADARRARRRVPSAVRGPRAPARCAAGCRRAARSRPARAHRLRGRARTAPRARPSRAGAAHDVAEHAQAPQAAGVVGEVPVELALRRR